MYTVIKNAIEDAATKAQGIALQQHSEYCDRKERFIQ